jgi:23S rRNA (adenine2503-C2)-methyltransferase
MENIAKTHLIGQDRDGLAQICMGLGVPERQVKMRVSQIWNWLYQRGAKDFETITTLSKDLRSALQEACDISRPEVVTEQISVDGTRKWLIRFAPGIEVETVFIPDNNRGTLCVSSQVGCTLNCSFCHTGTQKLVRNLTAHEIVAQLLIAKDALEEWPDTMEQFEARKVTNVVMMGMGEPLYNFDNVKQALQIFSDNEGLSLSKRRITLSTSGVVPMIEKCGEEIGVMLAISLHGTTNEIRDKLVPLNKKYPIKELIEACRNYPGLSNARRITFEYVMIKDVNDTVADAKRLVKLLGGIPSKINLIPFNPWPGTDYICSDWEKIEAFAEVVNRAGYASPVRTPRGRDIMAACGQLKSESEKIRASEARAAAAQ